MILVMILILSQLKTTCTEIITEEAMLAKNCVIAVCNKMTTMESELNALDGFAGDGDCGSTFAHASTVVRERMKTFDIKSSQQLLLYLSEIFEEEVGGTGGALYALMLSAMADSFTTPIMSKNFFESLTKACDVVQKYGGAKPGDRTLLNMEMLEDKHLKLHVFYVDPLYAAVEKINSGESNWDVILEVSKNAAQSTAQMKARAGRASYTAKEVQTKPDAGAVAIASFMLVVWETIQHTKS
ncbi:DAK2 domain protein [Dictyocaulus viviparus]|uniref:DAK2 domain protein n=1 Tax=Dictyocaulus viviparus TaxID=29172 RepID=A0A0D8X882_DICVI|nr:DAK2 domain protein [Dictyocaulus viviparus]